MKPNRLVVVLLISLAFNLGFATQAVLDWSSARGSACESSEVADLSCYPTEFHRLCNNLESTLGELRIEQAEQTRRLAELMASNEPDATAIGDCLDRLSKTERSIKGAVIDTVLAQRATLDPESRKSFCGHVQKRLCDPWVDCQPSGDCMPHDKHSESGCPDKNSDPNANRRQL